MGIQGQDWCTWGTSLARFLDQHQPQRDAGRKTEFVRRAGPRGASAD